MTSRNRGGFTLLELLVVIVVMSLLLGLLTVFGPMGSRWQRTRGAAHNIAAAMVLARGQAIASGRAVALRVPDEPSWLDVTVTPGKIIFEPDGSATGGTVELQEGGRRIVVSADWLTGRVSIDEE